MTDAADALLSVMYDMIVKLKRICVICVLDLMTLLFWHGLLDYNFLSSCYDTKKSPHVVLL